MNPKTHENIYSLKGWEKVYKFTVVQCLKNKALIIELAFILLIMIAQTPVVCLIQNGTKAANKKVVSVENKLENVSKVYVYDSLDSGIITDLKDKDGILADCSIVETYEMVKLGDKDCLIELKLDFTSYSINAIRGNDSLITDDELSSIRDFAEEKYLNKLYENCGLSKENQEILANGCYVSDADEKDYVSKNHSIYSDRMVSTDISSYVIIIFMFIALTSSYIIVNVSLEKTSKLAETILVSVRPMALLFGKIFGVLSIIVSVVVLGIIGSNACNYVLEHVMGYDLNKAVSGFDFSVLVKYGIKNSIICVFCLLLAISIMSMLAAIFGAACTKAEDLQGANFVPIMFSFVGYFGAFALFTSKYVELISILPPFSLMVLPIMYITERISLIVFIIGLLVQIAVLIGLLLAATRVYKKLLLSGNSKPKLGEIIKKMRG